jgi:hypothetical protein
MSEDKDSQNKNANNKVDISYNFWLGIVNLFQTFEYLGSAKDKQADIQAVHQLLDVESNDY